MKAILLLNLTIWLLFIQANNLAAQSFNVKSYKATVSGTSTLHEWKSTIEKLDCKGTFTLANNTLTGIKGVVVKIPVNSIKSPKGKMMDNKTYNAFNHEKYPNITFTLVSNKINGDNETLDVKGNLEMAGTTKAIALTLKYKILPDGGLQISSSKNLIMTDYKMEPPTAMMGTIKVGDEVVVTFDLILTTNNTL